MLLHPRSMLTIIMWVIQFLASTPQVKKIIYNKSCMHVKTLSSVIIKCLVSSYIILKGVVVKRSKKIFVALKITSNKAEVVGHPLAKT